MTAFLDRRRAIAVHSTRHALKAPVPRPATSWQALAGCAGCDPGLFHARATQRAALACCAACPVAEACLLTALVHEAAAGYRFGVWGGATARRRAQIVAYLAGRRLSVAALLASEESWWAARLAQPSTSGAAA